MSKTTMNKTPPTQTALQESLRAEFDVGISMAADPENARLPDLALRITSLHSPWYKKTCPVCLDKFREGDRVRLCPECGKPYHDDRQYGMHCWQKHFTGGHICTEGGEDRFADPPRSIPRCDFTWASNTPETLSPAAGIGNDCADTRRPRC